MLLTKRYSSPQLHLHGCLLTTAYSPSRLHHRRPLNLVRSPPDLHQRRLHNFLFTRQLLRLLRLLRRNLLAFTFSLSLHKTPLTAPMRYQNTYSPGKLQPNERSLCYWPPPSLSRSLSRCFVEIKFTLLMATD